MSATTAKVNPTAKMITQAVLSRLEKGTLYFMATKLLSDSDMKELDDHLRSLSPVNDDVPDLDRVYDVAVSSYIRKLQSHHSTNGAVHE